MLFMGILFAGARMESVASAQMTSASASEIRHILDQQESAWNRGDGTAWATAFADDADFVNILGQSFPGRDAIAEQHRRILAGPFHGSHTTITVRQFTEIAPGVALIETMHEVTGYKFLPPGIAPTAEGILKTRMTYVAVKRDASWWLIAAQNTAIVPGMEAGPTAH
jgi:uncharacterized protein (TIGR02246 family)